MATAGDPQITKFRDEFSNNSLSPCQESTTRYFQEKFEESYKIGHGKRGSSFVICMTEDRQGWNHDTEVVKNVFQRLDIKCEFSQFSFNPTYSELKNQLIEFAKNPQNCSLDCVFVVFMAHGGQFGSNVLVTLKRDKGDQEDSMFALFEECSVIFTRKDSLLTYKPKSFIIQCCRETHPLSPQHEFHNLHPPEPLYSFKDYFFFCAKEPGYKATRTETHGSEFIQRFFRYLHKHSHNNDIEEIFKKTLNKYPDGPGGRPQLFHSAERNLNLFPGIEKGTVDHFNKIGGSHPVMEGGNGSSSDDDHVKYEGTSLVLSVDGNSQDVILDTLQTRTELENGLTEAVDGRLVITEIRPGSIILDLKIYGTRTLKRLQYMSDKNLLTRWFKDYVSRKTRNTKWAGCSRHLTSVLLIENSDLTDVFALPENVFEESSATAKSRRQDLERGGSTMGEHLLRRVSVPLTQERRRKKIMENENSSNEEEDSSRYTWFRGAASNIVSSQYEGAGLQLAGEIMSYYEQQEHGPTEETRVNLVKPFQSDIQDDQYQSTCINQYVSNPPDSKDMRSVYKLKKKKGISVEKGHKRKKLKGNWNEKVSKGKQRKGHIDRAESIQKKGNYPLGKNVYKQNRRKGEIDRKRLKTTEEKGYGNKKDTTRKKYGNVASKKRKSATYFAKGESYIPSKRMKASSTYNEEDSADEVYLKVPNRDNSKKEESAGCTKNGVALDEKISNKEESSEDSYIPESKDSDKDSRNKKSSDDNSPDIVDSDKDKNKKKYLVEYSSGEYDSSEDISDEEDSSEDSSEGSDESTSSTEEDSEEDTSDGEITDEDRGADSEDESTSD